MCYDAGFQMCIQPFQVTSTVFICKKEPIESRLNQAKDEYIVLRFLNLIHKISSQQDI